MYSFETMLSQFLSIKGAIIVRSRKPHWTDGILRPLRYSEQPVRCCRTTIVMLSRAKLMDPSPPFGIFCVFRGQKENR